MLPYKNNLVFLLRQCQGKMEIEIRLLARAHACKDLINLCLPALSACSIFRYVFLMSAFECLLSHAGMPVPTLLLKYLDAFVCLSFMRLICVGCSFSIPLSLCLSLLMSLPVSLLFALSTCLFAVALRTLRNTFLGSFGGSRNFRNGDA